MRLYWLAIAGALGACSPYNPDLTSTPFLCGSGTPACPDGFTCMAQGSAGAMVCVGSGPAAPDAGQTGFRCQDDHAVEPNDTLAQAIDTPVASERDSIKFGPFAICPMGDKDTFKVDITQNLQNLTATIEYDAGGDPLNVNILDSGGATQSAGQPVAGMTGMVTATVPNEPAGTVYVQVFGPTQAGSAGGENNYAVTITVTGP